MYKDIKQMEDLQFDRFIGKISKDSPMMEEDMPVPLIPVHEEERLIEYAGEDDLLLMVPEIRDLHERLRPVAPPPE